MAALAIFAYFQMQLSRQALSSAERNHLSTLARIQARSAIEELLSQISTEINNPESRLYRALKARLDGTFQRLNLMPFLKPPEILLQPTWGRQGAKLKSDIQGEVLGNLALLRSPRRSVDPFGNREWVGILTLTSVARMSSPRGQVHRLASATYELRSVLPGPPKPFAGLPLFVGDHRALMNPQAIQARRQELKAEYEALRQAMLQASQAAQGTEKGQLEGFVQGLLDPAALEETLVDFPQTPTPLFGPYHVVQAFSSEILDPMRELEPLQEARQAARQSYEGFSGAPAEKVQRAFAWIQALTRELDSLWRYRWRFTLAGPGDPVFEERIGPYLPRLNRDYFLDRVHLVAKPEDELIQRWQSGAARLNGILDLRSPSPVTISGNPAGKLLVLVGPGPVTLEALYPMEEEPRGRLTVVSLGANVEVRGFAQASVVLLKDEASNVGTFRLPTGSHLRGALLAPDSPPGSLELRGQLEKDPGVDHGHNPHHAQHADQPDDHLFVVSPTPVFLAGGNS